jgi:hypothetical protein
MSINLDSINLDDDALYENVMEIRNIPKHSSDTERFDILDEQSDEQLYEQLDDANITEKPCFSFWWIVLILVVILVTVIWMRPAMLFGPVHHAISSNVDVERLVGLSPQFGPTSRFTFVK